MNTFRFSSAALLLAGVVVLCSCAPDEPPASPLPIVIPGDSEAIVYSKHVEPILRASCDGVGCHFNGERGGGVTLDTWQRAVDGSPEFGTELVPFAPTRSHFFQHINTDTTLGPTADPRMPLGRDPLPIEQIRTIRRWIAEGARNDDGTIPLAGADRPRAFVTCQSEDIVAVIDLATNRIARYINVGERSTGTPESPHNAALSPDGRSLYINHIAAGFVEKFDARTFEKLGSVRVGVSPAQVAVAHDGSWFLASNFDISTNPQRFIVRVDAATMQVTDTIFDVGTAPHGVVITPDGTHAITTNALSDDLAWINLSTLEVERIIPASPDNRLAVGTVSRIEPYQGVFIDNGTRFLFTCRKSNEVRVLDLATLRVVDSIAVGTSPLIPGLRPDGGELWIPNRLGNTVSIINPATRAVVATLPGFGQQPHTVAFTRDGRTAYVSCENTTGSAHHATSSSSIPGLVYVVDVATRTVKQIVEVGGFAAGIAVGG